jgi:serine/threonine protein kinase
MEETSQDQRITIGSYRLARLLGMGPVSRTHLAERQSLPGDAVVVKIFEALPRLSAEEQGQVLEEVRLLTYLEHPTILPILDNGVYEQMLYVVYPYAGGGSLRQRLTEAAGELLPLKDVLAILRQVGEALHVAHMQHIVHGNLKPENILFQNDGKVLLGDFLLPTLARSEQTSRLLSTFAAFYMAPEQFHSAATPLSDQYALACLAYELLTGQPPFEADNLTLLARLHATQKPVSPASLQPQRAQHVEQALLRALAKRPEKRYPDLQSFLTELVAPPPLPVPISAQETLPVPAQSPPTLSAVAKAEPSGEVSEEVLPIDSPVLKEESRALVPYGAASSALLARPGTHSSQRRTWLTVVLLSLALLVSLSGLLLFFDASLPGRIQAGPTATVSAHQPGSSPTQAATPSPTASATLGSISLPPSPTPVRHPSPVSHPSPTASPGASPTPTPTPAPALSCAVHYWVSSQWQDGFVANVTISNTGSTPIQGWTLVFSFSAGQTLSYGWNGHFAQNGAQVSISNDGSDATIGPGGSVTPGFVGSWHWSNPAPASFALNGVACG